MISPPGRVVGAGLLCRQLADHIGFVDIFNLQVRWAFDVLTGPRIVRHLESLHIVMDPDGPRHIALEFPLHDTLTTIVPSLGMEETGFTDTSAIRHCSDNGPLIN